MLTESTGEYRRLGYIRDARSRSWCVDGREIVETISVEDDRLWEDRNGVINFIVEEVYSRHRPRLDDISHQNIQDCIKSYVTQSSWIVSRPAGWSDLRFRLARCHRIEQMMECVNNKLAERIAETDVYYWQVKFVKANRFLTRGELPGHPDGIPGELSDNFSEAMTFWVENEAKEAAHEFCQGYIAAGIKIPQIEIVAFSSTHKEIPKPKLYIPLPKK